ncbi:MAG: peptidase U32 family protein [Pseudomonadota bacterium]
MNKELELLAPGGDIDSIKAAILAGANAIYCGLDKFNARNRAENIILDDLYGIIRLAHKHNCEVFLTLNIIILESEIPTIITLLNKLVNTHIDGIIVQDFGLFYLLTHYFPSLHIHASTQLTTHNEGQIKFLSKLAATRVNLSRELDLKEIKDLSSVSHKHNVLTEVFVHGSNCIAFSGICYMSSVNGGNSGNRGRCSQPCRDQYLTTAEGKDFPLNIKDNSAFSDLRELSDAGVDSVKIEGRIKKYHYVYTVVSSWRKHLQSFYLQNKVDNDNSGLRKVFNRDFSNSFLQGNISRDVFIDNPRDNSAIYFSKHLIKKADTADDGLSQAKKALYDVKTEIINDVKSRIEQLSTNKAAVIICFSGKAGSALEVSIQTPESAFVLFSDSLLRAVTAKKECSDLKNSPKAKKSTAQCLDYELILSRFKSINDSEYFIQTLDCENIQGDLFIPFKELSAIKKQILFILNKNKETIDPIDALIIKKNDKLSYSQNQSNASLSVLISSFDDLYLCDKSSAEIYFELPNSFNNKLAEFVNMFKTLIAEGKKLIPWFPSVLIGKDYHAAVDFLHQLQPEYIVTNNTGIAYEAYQLGISWIAGPYLNLVNSYSLLCLKEYFNCDGAFISNEINKNQIKRIKQPDNFKLLYSIYHPIVLMTSKVCFFHQVTGCKKNIVDGACIQRCEKSSFITNLKEVSFFIKKTKGNYHNIYNQANFLNTDIVNDFPSQFSSFFIDLRDIKTDTRLKVGKLELVKYFENYINGNNTLDKVLKQNIQPSTDTQYKKGL